MGTRMALARHGVFDRVDAAEPDLQGRKPVALLWRMGADTPWELRNIFDTPRHTKSRCFPVVARDPAACGGRDGAYAGFCAAVGYPNRGDDHLSRSAVADTLKRSTRLH